MENHDDVIVKVFKVEKTGVELKELTLFYMRQPIDLEAACLDYFKFACAESDFDEYLQHTYGPFIQMDEATSETSAWSEKQPKIETGTAGAAKSKNKKNKLSSFGRDSSCEEDSDDDVILLSDEEEKFDTKKSFSKLDRFKNTSQLRKFLEVSIGSENNHIIDRRHGHDYGTIYLSDSDDECKKGKKPLIRPIALSKLQWKPEPLTTSTPINRRNLVNNRPRKNIIQKQFERLPRLPDSYLEGIADFTQKKSVMQDIISEVRSKIKSETDKTKNSKAPIFPKLSCLANIDDNLPQRGYNSIKCLKPMQQVNVYSSNLGRAPCKNTTPVKTKENNDFSARLSTQFKENSDVAALDVRYKDTSVLSSNKSSITTTLDKKSGSIALSSNKIELSKVWHPLEKTVIASMAMKVQDTTKEFEDCLSEKIIGNTSPALPTAESSNALPEQKGLEDPLSKETPRMCNDIISNSNEIITTLTEQNFNLVSDESKSLTRSHILAKCDVICPTKENKNDIIENKISDAILNISILPQKGSEYAVTSSLLEIGCDKLSKKELILENQISASDNSVLSTNSDKSSDKTSDSIRND